jgi:hypothetical protein
VVHRCRLLLFFWVCFFRRTIDLSKDLHTIF